MINNKKLVVFDLDGTLNKTETFAVPSILDGLKDYGITHFSASDIMETFGEIDEDTNKLFFGSRHKELAYEFWKKVEYYQETRYKDKFNTYDGVIELLISLKEKGYLLSICSNADINYIELVCKRLKLIEYMDFLQPLVLGKTKNDTLGMLLEKVKPDKSIMVGDRYFDMEAARTNRIPFIGCEYGFARESELDKGDILVKKPMDIVKAIERLIG